MVRIRRVRPTLEHLHYPFEMLEYTFYYPYKTENLHCQADQLMFASVTRAHGKHRLKEIPLRHENGNFF
jgi:hypothetical protein